MLKMKIATCESLLVCMTRHRKFGIYSACLRCLESFLARMETSFKQNIRRVVYTSQKNCHTIYARVDAA